MTSVFEPSSLVQTAVPVSEPPRCQAERNQWMGPSRPWHWAWSMGSSWTARPCVSAPGCMPIVVERIALWGLRPVGRGGRVATVCNPRGGGPENLDVGYELGTSRQAEAAIRCRGAVLTWSPIFPRLVLFALSLFASMIAVPYTRGGPGGDDVLGLIGIGLALAGILPRVRARGVEGPVEPPRVSRPLIACAFVLGAAAWWNSNYSSPARWAINRTVYAPGCTCDDCIRALGLVSLQPVSSGCTVLPAYRYAWGQLGILSAATGTLGVLPIFRRRPTARRADGVALRCTRCGYDMTGTPGPVCPECGEDCGLKRGDAA